MKTLVSLAMLFALLSVPSHGWSKEVPEEPQVPKAARKGEMLFIEYDYFEALEAFQGALEQEPEHPFVMRRIADCYRLMGLPEDARDWYKRTVQAGGFDPLDYYYCSEVHRQLGEYEAANFWLKQFETKAPEDTRASRVFENPDYFKDLSVDTREFWAEALEVNESRAILPPSKYEELLVIPIATEIEGGWFPHRRFLENYDLYQTSVDDQFNLVAAEEMLGDVQSKFLDGPSCYDPIRERLYVTRFLTKNHRPALDFNSTVYSMILCYALEDGEWVEQDFMPLNDDMYSSAYPVLSPDGSQLFFASNREGGEGGMDLYYSLWNPQTNQWNPPIPLSDRINTEGDEIYPSFAPDGRFIFASDGHPSLGGLDIFFTDLRMKDAPVTNPGLPVNSTDDDFGMVWVGDSYGYFCSDRATGTGGDDLFWWESMQEVIETEIALMDTEGNPLYPELVEIKNLRTDDVQRRGSSRGSFTVELNGADPYEISWEQEGRKMVMHCKPEDTPYGLRYVYDSPNKTEFLADARVASFRESTFRKKKVPHAGWQQLNLTDDLAYDAAKAADANKFMAATWMDEPARPAPGELVYLKDMETGEVQTALATPEGVEFPVISGHLHALVWFKDGNSKQTRYITTEDDGEQSFANFVETRENWQLAMRDVPQFDENIDHGEFLMAALTASVEGLGTVEYADELLFMLKEGREVEVVNGSTRVHAHDIYFGFDRSRLTDREKKKMEDFAEQLQAFPDATFEIIAHTDARGSKGYNTSLSKYRAESTKDQLVALGVDADRINVIWKGEEEPVNHCIDGVPCSMQEHSLNRRAELYIVLPELPVFGN